MGHGGLVGNSNATVETSCRSDMFCHYSFTSFSRAYSITTLVYITCASFLGSCCLLSCYVFVCFGIWIQVAIVAYVTWWLMGKNHLPPPLPSCPPLKHCLYAFWDEHGEKNKFHPILFTKWLIGFRMLAFFWTSGLCLRIKQTLLKTSLILCGYDSAAPNGRSRLYAWTVWRSPHSSAVSPHGGGLIGGPKELNVLSLLLTKALGCGRSEDWSGGKWWQGQGAEQVSIA